MSPVDNNAQLVRHFLSWLRDVRNRRASTIYQYASTLQHFLSFLDGRPLGDAPLITIEQWITRPRGGRAHGEMASPATRAKDAAILRSLYTFLHARGTIARNPTALLGAPTVHNEDPRPLADEHWLALWHTCPIDERVAFGLSFFCSLRRFEVCRLRPTQLVWPNIFELERKGGSLTTFPIATTLDVFDTRLPHLQAGAFQFELEAFVSKRATAPYLIGWGEVGELRPSGARRTHPKPDGMTDPAQLNKRLTRACERARVPHYTPHQLRHAFVTNLLRGGVPLHLVAKLAGHVDTRVTLRYTKAGGDELREWLRGVSRHD